MAAPLLAGSSATRVLVGGRELVYFGGCDYLGLAHDARVVDALCRSARTNGISPGAARGTSGDHEEYGALERELADFLGAESALIVGEGALANLVAAETLARSGARHALFDAAAHVTGRQAARAAGLALADFAHRDAAQATRLAREWASEGVVVWSDGMYPTRGSLAPIAELALDLPTTGAWLVVDDAHALGVVGPEGRGSATSLDLTDPRALVTGTFSKALGTYGGFLAGARATIEAARASSPTFAATTPPPACVAHATRVALALVASEPVRLARLQANRARMAAGLAALGLPVRAGALPVFALALPELERVHAALFSAGYLVPITDYPGDDPPRVLRLVVRSEHTADEIDALLAAWSTVP